MHGYFGLGFVMYIGAYRFVITLLLAVSFGPSFIRDRCLRRRITTAWCQFGHTAKKSETHRGFRPSLAASECCSAIETLSRRYSFGMRGLRYCLRALSSSSLLVA